MQRDTVSMIRGRVYKLGNFLKEKILCIHEWIYEDKKTAQTEYLAPILKSVRPSDRNL
jgi:hypothetical protein